MADDDFEDEPTLDEEDIDEDVLEEDFVEEDDVLDDDLAKKIDPEIIDAVAVPGVLRRAPPEPAAEEEEDDVVDLDEELHPDDVEEALDVVLRERTVAAGLEEDEEDDDEPDDRGEAGTKIVPRRENEFLCKSCFLVLPRHQLADEKRMICRDRVKQPRPATVARVVAAAASGALLGNQPATGRSRAFGVRGASCRCSWPGAAARGSGRRGSPLSAGVVYYAALFCVERVLRRASRPSRSRAGVALYWAAAGALIGWLRAGTAFNP